MHMQIHLRHMIPADPHHASTHLWANVKHQRQLPQLSARHHPSRSSDCSSLASARQWRTRLSASASETQVAADANAATTRSRTLLCTSIIADTPDDALAQMKAAKAAGAEVAELRLDWFREFDPEDDLPRLIQNDTLPVIITLRPEWEGGNFAGPEAIRLAVLKYAAVVGAPYVDVEFKAALPFFAGGDVDVPISTKIILSSHDYGGTPAYEELNTLAAKMVEAGADIVKIATTANDVSDCVTIFQLLASKRSEMIAIAMGERGLPTRLLAPKYGSYLTFGALSPDKASAPGQATLSQIREMYRLQDQGPDTKVYGIVGNPVSHSRSPLLHNEAMKAAHVDSVYIPFLVDNMASFLQSFSMQEFAGFSITIPHKEAALQGADAVDDVAAQIGAVNTLVRQSDGSLKGYNTDWAAAVDAIEVALCERRQSQQAAESAPSRDTSASGGSCLAGSVVVVLGAGGAGRALAFGAASRGAKVVIANRTLDRAEQLARDLGPQATAVTLQDVSSGQVQGTVLVNTTALGMAPNVAQTPISAAALGNFEVVFDAVYTPLQTQLLQDAQAAGCTTITGLEMFVGQAAEQFRLFTGCEPNVEAMRSTVLKSLQV